MCRRMGWVSWGCWSLNRVSLIFAPVGIFLVWSLDRVPRLYQLKLQCINAQLNGRTLFKEMLGWFIKAEKQKLSMLQKQNKADLFMLFLVFCFSFEYRLSFLVACSGTRSVRTIKKVGGLHVRSAMSRIQSQESLLFETPFLFLTPQVIWEPGTGKSTSFRNGYQKFEVNPKRSQRSLYFFIMYTCLFEHYAADDDDDDMSEAVEIRWKLGPPHPNAERLLLRLATKSKW